MTKANPKAKKIKITEQALLEHRINKLRESNRALKAANRTMRQAATHINPSAIQLRELVKITKHLNLALYCMIDLFETKGVLIRAGDWKHQSVNLDMVLQERIELFEKQAVKELRDVPDYNNIRNT